VTSVDNKPKRGLGRGLGALLPEARTAYGGPLMSAAMAGPNPEAVEDDSMGKQRRNARILPIDRLRPGKFQPRRVFDDNAIDELAASIRMRGLLQPILVRPLGDDFFEIVAGERRWRASQRAGLQEMPVVIRDLSDRETLEIGLVENLQRQDLDPVDEAEGFKRLIDDFGHTQEEVSRVVAKSRSHVANTMRLLVLPSAVLDMVRQGQISAGHARTLVGRQDAASLAEKIIDESLSVRQTERMIADLNQLEKNPLAIPRVANDTNRNYNPDLDEPEKAETRRRITDAIRRGGAKDADTLALEQDLSLRLGLKVAIDYKGGKGKVVIDYQTLEQLDGLLARLM
jgi:ParB family chromosome partitioning protein